MWDSDVLSVGDSGFKLPSIPNNTVHGSGTVTRRLHFPAVRHDRIFLYPPRGARAENVFLFVRSSVLSLHHLGGDGRLRHTRRSTTLTLTSEGDAEQSRRFFDSALGACAGRCLAALFEMLAAPIFPCQIKKRETHRENCKVPCAQSASSYWQSAKLRGGPPPSPSHSGIPEGRCDPRYVNMAHERKSLRNFTSRSSDTLASEICAMFPTFTSIRYQSVAVFFHHRFTS